MGIPLSKLSDRRVFRKLQKSVSSIGKCGICKKPITDVHPDEVRMIKIGGKSKPVHDDCYFEKLGDEVEKHPICSPRVRRG